MLSPVSADEIDNSFLSEVGRAKTIEDQLEDAGPQWAVHFCGAAIQPGLDCRFVGQLGSGVVDASIVANKLMLTSKQNDGLVLGSA